jgi:isocitrate/isopropylmalate dehydrogenase
MRLVQDPTRFDVILMENLYGDIVSDLAAGLIGGLGVAPGANFGDEYAVFEAVHGSAPDIAGKGIANPLSLLMSAVMMLNHLAVTRNMPQLKTIGVHIRTAYDRALQDGEKTGDIGGTLSTEQFADAVIKRL